MANIPHPIPASARSITIDHPTTAHRFTLLAVILAIAFMAMPLISASEAAAERAVTGSFSSVVKQVSPSVVTVSTSKTVRNRGNPNLDEDQQNMLRRFFGFGPGAGDEDEGGGRGGRGFKQQALGSGVIVSADGLILTNNHVIDGADDIKVSLANGHEEYSAKLIGTDPKTDLAVLRIEVGKKLPVISFGDSDKAEVGDLVLAIGNPFGVGQTVTMGIISARSRGLGLAAYEDFLQTDASINPGNSGGALIDITGKLIGINTAILSPSGGNLGIGFAVPINLARGIMDGIVTKGKVVRGFLGVRIQPVTADIAESFKLPNEEGVLVGEVTEGSPAGKGGIKKGDVITAFNDNKVDDPRHLSLMAAQTAPGAKVELSVLRDSKPLKIEVTVGEMPSSGESDDTKEAITHGKHAVRGKLGVRLTDLDEQKRDRLEIPATVHGALIGEVLPDSPAAEAGLAPGDVIVEIARKAVQNAAEAAAAIGDASGKILLQVWNKNGMHYVVVHPAKDEK